MRSNVAFAVAALAASASAFDIPFLSKRQGTCPSVWNDISSELTGLFLTDGQCNDAARAAIRGVFHDCFPDGGCDGSLMLFSDELSRPINSPMAATMNSLKALTTKYNVGAADLLMFAGSHAVATCPGGPIVQTLIGRTDATGPCPDGQLPAADIAGDASVALFASKGFSGKDLAALIGAHTASRQFNTAPVDIGAAQDTTPGFWDITFFIETIKNTAPFRFISDINIANQADAGPWFTRFSTDKSAWDAAFVDAMARLELLGNDKSSMVDCTGALPKSQAKSRRNDRLAALFSR